MSRKANFPIYFGKSHNCLSERALREENSSEPSIREASHTFFSIDSPIEMLDVAVSVLPTSAAAMHLSRQNVYLLLR